MKFEDVKCSLVECGLAMECSSWGDGIPPSSAGVYAFYVDSECVYVGQSEDMKRRTASHSAKKKWPEYSIFWVECSNRNKVERWFIQQLKPVCNVQTGKGRADQRLSHFTVYATPTNKRFVVSRKKRDRVPFNDQWNEAMNLYRKAKERGNEK